ncbi:uncharacterized protein LOC112528340 [Cynara cardunculus var. scolymus]|uniref:Phox/Bem1p n=1 Tax=Cynara cardunculus var. scolymus TaxID=59895 RepID=A0A103XRQ8_CYNCS|nr:uncharacterized protein LOC112528340 [Cynara cardunculus var. scolymus]KVH95657.1 Phox/Bem1p [Cynara cardunculus var. scolymus]
MAGPSLATRKPPTIKFLCSYGGRILPRYTDGKLRYCGGETRVIAVDRSLSFSELLVKLGEICGTPAVALRCQLPTEDLDALVSITCDEDLVNLIEEYDRKARVQSSSNLKIRAFLTLSKKSSSIPSTSSASRFSSSTTIDLEISSPKSPPSSTSNSPARFPIAATSHCIQQVSKPSRKLPFRYDKSAGKLLRYACENSSQSYLVHNGNHWQ